MKKVIIIGDSTHNTLSAVRSFGEGKVPFTLILVCQQDNCYVRYSKYLRHGNLYVISELDECTVVLRQLAAEKGQLLMTTFDAAAEWVDAREPQLSKLFLTPCRGKQLGVLFNKEAQCKLAKDHGIYGFCMYHYWFNTDICCSKNQWKCSWHIRKLISSTAFHGRTTIGPMDGKPRTAPQKLLIAHDFDDEKDWIDHFNYMLPFFKDPRYMSKNNKPLMVIYIPNLIPQA